MDTQLILQWTVTTTLWTVQEVVLSKKSSVSPIHDGQITMTHQLRNRTVLMQGKGLCMYGTKIGEHDIYSQITLFGS